MMARLVLQIEFHAALCSGDLDADFFSHWTQTGIKVALQNQVHSRVRRSVLDNEPLLKF